MTLDLEEALKLREVVQRSGIVLVLTHNYTGYPMVKEARELVRTGGLGKILKVVAEYPQGWLLNSIDQERQKQASWRTDPERAGASSCIGDIGTHAENLARYITRLEIDELWTFPPSSKDGASRTMETCLCECLSRGGTGHRGGSDRSANSGRIGFSHR